MASTITVKPNPDKKINGDVVKVRDPVSGDFIPGDGVIVGNNAYWHRRLRDGDVVQIAPGEIGKAAPAIDPHLAAAIGDLDPDQDGDFTAAGIPDLGRLKEILGRSVTATERDAAWLAHQKGSDN